MNVTASMNQTAINAQAWFATTARALTFFNTLLLVVLLPQLLIPAPDFWASWVFFRAVVSGVLAIFTLCLTIYFFPWIASLKARRLAVVMFVYAAWNVIVLVATIFDAIHCVDYAYCWDPITSKMRVITVLWCVHQVVAILLGAYGLLMVLSRQPTTVEPQNYTDIPDGPSTADIINNMKLT